MVLHLRNSLQSTVIQGNSAAALFDGLLAELPVVFFTSTTSHYIGVVNLGRWGATKWRGKHMPCIYTCFMDPLVLEMAQEVVKSVDNITTRSPLLNSQQRQVNTNRAFMDV